MRAYFGFVVLLLVVGFVFMPSAMVSSNDSTGKSAQAKKSIQGKEPNRFAPTSTSETLNVDSASGDLGDCFMPGSCTLRAAIAAANELPGPDVIQFNIGSGPVTIALSGALPLILGPVTINGTTQPGYAGTPLIEVDGFNAGTTDGFTFRSSAAGSQVQGLAINRFLGDAIVIQADTCTVSGNYIGVGLDGISDRGNNGSGVRIVEFSGPVVQGADDFRAAAASENQILNNHIAFNNGDGVTIGGLDGSENANTITGNSIHDNGQLGIDIDNDGVTANDSCDTDGGPNNSQNFPVLTSAVSSSGTLTIQGLLETDSSSEIIYRIDFYASPSGDPSLHGEGQTPIGFINVTAEPDCVVNFMASFPDPLAGGFITATATSQANSNTSEFSEWIQATSGPCTITCPNDIITQTAPGLCSAAVTYPPPTKSPDCGTLPVNCTPPSGSTFQKGTTVVNCVTGTPTLFSTSATTASCSFSVTVVDNQPPVVQCPANITTQLEAGQQSKVVQYPFPTAEDNCGRIAAIACIPPSGSQFPAGTTTVRCQITDDSTNNTICTFTVSVVDPRPPVITCPANINVQSNQQCVAVVNYPAPTVSGTTGATVTCTPPSGTTFTAGTTAVTCTAVSTIGTRVTCSFNVTVTPLVRPVVTLEGSGAQLDFGTGQAFPRRDPNPTARTFMIENTGCAPLNLSETITRTGSDVDSGRISNPDDSETFRLSIVNANGTETPVGPCSTPCITIAPGQKLTFRVRFNRVIPPYAGKTTGLSAREALPDLVTSRINFAGTTSFTIPLVGRVSPAVQLVNPSKTKKAARVRFERAGNEYVVTFGFYDPNLNVTRVRYDLLGSSGQVIESVELDISQQISALNPVRGQALRVEQRFSGANDNPNVTGVRVTITDAEGSSALSTLRVSEAIASGIAPASQANIFRPSRVKIHPGLKSEEQQ